MNIEIRHHRQPIRDFNNSFQIPAKETITEEVVQKMLDQPKKVVEIRLGLKGSVLTRLAVESGFKRWPCSWKTIKRTPDLRSAKLVAKILEVHAKDRGDKSSVLPTIESPTLKSKAPRILKTKAPRILNFKTLPLLKSKALLTRTYLNPIDIKNLISKEDYEGPAMGWPIEAALIQGSSKIKQASILKLSLGPKPTEKQKIKSLK